MSVQIITDSHSGISRQQAEELGVLRLSMPFTLDGVDYLEDEAPDRETFFAKISAGATMSTSQSSPAEIMALWDRALENHDQVVFMPLSSGLSGACATAKILAEEPEYEGRVFVVDNGRIATPLYRSVLDALEMAEHGLVRRSAGNWKTPEVRCPFMWRPVRWNISSAVGVYPQPLRRWERCWVSVRCCIWMSVF